MSRRQGVVGRQARRGGGHMKPTARRAVHHPTHMQSTCHAPCMYLWLASRPCKLTMVVSCILLSGGRGAAGGVRGSRWWRDGRNEWP